MAFDEYSYTAQKYLKFCFWGGIFLLSRRITTINNEELQIAIENNSAFSTVLSTEGFIATEVTRISQQEEIDFPS